MQNFEHAEQIIKSAFKLLDTSWMPSDSIEALGGRFRWLNQARTISLSLPRQCGKTTSIAKIAKHREDVVIFTHKYDFARQMIQQFELPPHRVLPFSRVNSDAIRGTTLRFKGYIFDETLIYSDEHQIDEGFKQIFGLHHDWNTYEQPFVLSVGT